MVRSDGRVVTASLYLRLVQSVPREAQPAGDQLCCGYVYRYAGFRAWASRWGAEATLAHLEGL